MAADLTDQLIDERYLVSKCVGRGGMGAVWEARHTLTLQRVALKTLLHDDLRASATPRLLKEARAAAALSSRHVVKIFDVRPDYVHDGAPLPFIVMELLEGLSLEQLLEFRVRLRPGEVLWVAEQIGVALSLAHARGVIHRDLKPGNIFLARSDDDEPVVKVCDFGLAKLRGPALNADLEQHSSSGAVFGTLGYMAPEQLTGSVNAVPQTDQWAFALVVFRALTGAHYFEKKSGVEVILATARGKLEPPSQRFFELSSAFDKWFLRSCSRDPALRFEGVSEQVAALRAALGNPPTEALGWSLREGTEAAPEAASSSPAPARRASKRYRIGLALSAAFSLLLIGLAAASAPSVARASRSAHEPPVEIRATLPNAAPAARSEDSAPMAALTSAPPAPSAPRVEPIAPRRTRLAEPAHPARVAAPASAASPQDPPVPAAAPTPLASPLLGPGAECRRSAECASRLCIADACR